MWRCLTVTLIWPVDKIGSVSVTWWICEAVTDLSELFWNKCRENCFHCLRAVYIYCTGMRLCNASLPLWLWHYKVTFYDCDDVASLVNTAVVWQETVKAMSVAVVNKSSAVVEMAAQMLHNSSFRFQVGLLLFNALFLKFSVISVNITIHNLLMKTIFLASLWLSTLCLQPLQHKRSLMLPNFVKKNTK